MSSSDFLDIAHGHPADRAERVFRAAVSAYCALTRPSRKEAAQLDDLALPLLPLVPAAARRFASAALSECRQAPVRLVRQLAEEPPAISAPLLVRSKVLTDLDLIGLIGRHGLPHAMAIARRPGLNSNIAKVIGALVSIGQAAREAMNVIEAEPEIAEAAPEPAPGQRAEQARQRLRRMMKPAFAPDREHEDRDPGAGWKAGDAHYPRLLSACMTGIRPLFHTALADALGVEFQQAQRMANSSGGDMLAQAMRALDLSVEQAFLLSALNAPGSFADMEAVRGFVEQYRSLDMASTRQAIEDMRKLAGRAADLEPPRSLPPYLRVL